MGENTAPHFSKQLPQGVARDSSLVALCCGEDPGSPWQTTGRASRCPGGWAPIGSQKPGCHGRGKAILRNRTVIADVFSNRWTEQVSVSVPVGTGSCPGVCSTRPSVGCPCGLSPRDWLGEQPPALGTQRRATPTESSAQRGRCAQRARAPEPVPVHRAVPPAPVPLLPSRLLFP